MLLAFYCSGAFIFLFNWGVFNRGAIPARHRERSGEAGGQNLKYEAGYWLE